MQSEKHNTSYSEQRKTQNMARSLYDTGYSQNYVLDAIQSKGFSYNEALVINFKAYEELHLERRRTFRIVLWCSGVLMVVLLSLGIFFEIQENQIVQSQIENGTATEISPNLYLIKGNFDQNKIALKAGTAAGIIFFLNLFSYFFKVLPRYKSIIRPVDYR